MTGAVNNQSQEVIQPELAEDLPSAGPASTDTRLSTEDSPFITLAPFSAKYVAPPNATLYETKDIIATSHGVSSLVAQPNITARSQWKAPHAAWHSEYASLKGAVVHHAAGSNSYTRSQSPSILRGIYQYHAVTLDWGDIGYNFLVDKYGQIFEGRTGSLDAPSGTMTVGAHAYRSNTHSVGISVLGNFVNVQPQKVSLDSITDIVSWLFFRSDIDPYSHWTNAKHQTVAAIVGHRDVSQTICPGLIYDHLPAIRSEVALRLKQAGETTSVPSYPLQFTKRIQHGNGWRNYNTWSAGDSQKNGYTDLLLRTADGKLRLYNGLSDQRFAPGRQIGTGWGSFVNLYPGIDFNGDSNPDILALKPNGDLWLYPGNGRGSFDDWESIGTGWGSFTNLTVLNHGRNDHPAIYGVLPDGTTKLYETNGRGYWSAFSQFPTHISYLNDARSIPDATGDGLSDIIVRTKTGGLFLYRGTSSGTFALQQRIGTGWASWQLVAGGDIKPNSRFTLFAVDQHNTLYHYLYRYSLNK